MTRVTLGRVDTRLPCMVRCIHNVENRGSGTQNWVILLSQLNNGWLPERSKGAALKTVVLKGTGGSNPPPSATRRDPSLMGA